MEKARWGRKCEGVYEEAIAASSTIDSSGGWSTHLEVSYVSFMIHWICMLPWGKSHELRKESLLKDTCLIMILQTVCHMTHSSRYRAFIASLQSIVIPEDWKAAKQGP
jgi:hypothetical protein